MEQLVGIQVIGKIKLVQRSAQQVLGVDFARQFDAEKRLQARMICRVVKHAVGNHSLVPPLAKFQHRVRLVSDGAQHLQNDLTGLCNGQMVSSQGIRKVLISSRQIGYENICLIQKS